MKEVSLFKQIIAIAAALGLGGVGGGVATRQFTTPTPPQYERFITDSEFTERLSKEAPWYKVEGQVMGAVSDVSALKADISTIREQQARIITKLDFIMDRMEK